jgi:transcriptional regulator with XRE-family HTH domain
METAPAIDVEALRAARESAGLTQSQLARIMDVAGGERVSQWERGEARPRSPKLLAAVARAIGVPARSLLVEPSDGLTLRWLRFAAGLSLEEVAEQIHFSWTALRRLEAHGSRRPVPVATVELLASVLMVPVDQVSIALSPR